MSQAQVDELTQLLNRYNHFTQESRDLLIELLQDLEDRVTTLEP